MKISELKGNEKVFLTVFLGKEILKEDVVEKDGKKIPYVTVEIKDKTGQTRFTAWRNDNVKMVKAHIGQKVKLINCWSSSYTSEEGTIYVNVSTGKYGRIEEIK